MAVVSGTQGSVTNASGYATAINQWSITVGVAEQDITSWDDVSGGVLWRSRIAGIREWSGSYSGLLDSAQIDGEGDLGLGAELSATFTIDSSETTPGTIAGTIIVTNVSFSVEADNPNSISVDFVGSGAPTFTAAAST